MADASTNQKNLSDSFLSLPPLVRERLASSQTAGIINDINENAGIYSSDRRRVVPVLIFRLVVKDIMPEQVIRALVSELEIKPEDAKRLAEEVVERVLTPVKQSLGEWGIDMEKIKSGTTWVVSRGGAAEVTAPALPNASTISAMSPRNPSLKSDELTARYDSVRPENDKLPSADDAASLVEMQKKRMAMPFDVGGKTFFPQRSAISLPPQETKIDMSAMPTLKEDGDRVKFREAVPSSPAPTVAPFMLHEELELMPVQTPKTFRSNTEANYPRPMPASGVPVRVEIGKSGEEKTVFGPSRFAPSSAPTFTKNPLEPSTMPSQGEFATLADRNSRAERANESFRKPPALPVAKAEPKIEGNTLDLRSQN